MTNSVGFLFRLPSRRGPVLACAAFLVLSALVLSALVLSATTAFAAESPKGSPSEVIFLAELIVLMLVGRLLGEAMQRIGQPSVMGQLVAGILLGPSLLGC